MTPSAPTLAPADSSSASGPPPPPAPLPPEVEPAFRTLETYDRGSSRGALVPIDEAVQAALGDPVKSALLESRLIPILERPTPDVAREYACRKLALIGSAASVPALVGLLAHPRLAHVARIALEVLPGPEATTALRTALPKLTGLRQVGVAQSLGVRRDPHSVDGLARLLNETDAEVASAAAWALGEIGDANSARALRQASPSSEKVRAAVADAGLACAERLNLASETKASRELYTHLTGPQHPAHVRAAAERGLATR